VKEWLKSVLNYRSYPKIKLGIRFLDHPVCTCRPTDPALESSALYKMLCKAVLGILSLLTDVSASPM